MQPARTQVVSTEHLSRLGGLDGFPKDARPIGASICTLTGVPECSSKILAARLILVSCRSIPSFTEQPWKKRPRQACEAIARDKTATLSQMCATNCSQWSGSGEARAHPLSNWVRTRSTSCIGRSRLSARCQGTCWDSQWGIRLADDSHRMLQLGQASSIRPAAPSNPRIGGLCQDMPLDINSYRPDACPMRGTERSKLFFKNMTLMS